MFRRTLQLSSALLAAMSAAMAIPIRQDPHAPGLADNFGRRGSPSAKRTRNTMANPVIRLNPKRMYQHESQA